MRKSFGPSAVVQAMESRLMLSTVLFSGPSSALYHPPAVHRAHAKSVGQKPQPTAGAKPGFVIAPQDGINPAVAKPTFTPAIVRHFYGVDNVSFNGVAGDGTGQTIAVIDAYHDAHFAPNGSPDFVNSDLHIFDTKYNLPDPPSFVQIPEAGYTSLPTTSNANWSIEEALDIEWAHAMAPGANLIVVECLLGTSLDEQKLHLITNGVAAARAAGASVISMSYAFDDIAADNLLDAAFTSTTTNTAFTAFAAAGDNGVAQTFYPATSPYVVSVGGTKITTSDDAGAYGNEVTWNDSNLFAGATGGGIAAYEPKPYYQAGETLSGDLRGVPDVALIADPLTGVFIVNNGAVKQLIGGTSLSSPAWAGIVAIADQGRALLGLPAMNGYDTTLPRLYALPSTDFHDITSGNNTYKPFSSMTGHTARVGYDLVTGLGSPVADKLVPDLAGGATVTGRAFIDANGDGLFDGPDTVLGGSSVYLDLNGNGGFDAGEPTAVADVGTGIYTFADRAGGETATVRLQSPSGAYVTTTNNAGYTTAYGSTRTADLGLFPISYSAAPGQSYAVSLDPTGSSVQISSGGVVIDSAPAAIVPSLSFSGPGGSVTVNGTNGNPTPAGGIAVTGAATVAVIGTPSADTFVTSATGVMFGVGPITFPATAALTLDPNGGADSLTANSGVTTIVAGPAGGGVLTRSFSNLSIDASAAVVFAPSAAVSDRTLAVVASLSVSGTLDLTTNDMVVQAAALPSVQSQLRSGLSTGTGIIGGSLARRTTVAYATAAEHAAVFDGYTPGPGDVLLKSTYFGDANLDGKVDGSDYSLIDAHYPAAGDWSAGDFNFDGVIDGSDYSLIDNAFNSQGPRLA